ncbi:hypothetical protein GH816_03060 [Betaproteobacteria bacterium LSUCC0115]|nr:hypothetical protein [Burkholderiales bacterium LSUCC0115]
MTLYNKVKELLPKHKGAIADETFLLLDVKDYHLTQISTVHQLLLASNTKMSYRDRTYLAQFENYAKLIKTDGVNIVLADNSQTYSAFYFWLFLKQSQRDSTFIYAPRGFSEIIFKLRVLKDLYDDFVTHILQGPGVFPNKDDIEKNMSFVIGSADKMTHTRFAADLFVKVKSGILAMPGWARTENNDERDYLEANGIWPVVTFEGHAFAVK